MIFYPHVMKLPKTVKELGRRFNAAGHVLYVVGGAVRDAVMGVEPHDYDLATDATPDRVQTVLGDFPSSCDETGKSFGVIRARFEGGEEYEIATFRQDIGSGRRPDSVVFSTIAEDVKRRDLTINALFYDINDEKIVDFVGGMADIEANIIRTIGVPAERFAEDRLRIMRALRFASRFGWSIEEVTDRAIAQNHSLDGVTAERIHDEFTKAITSAKHPWLFFSLLENFDLYQVIFPGMDHARFRFHTSRSVPVNLALLFPYGDPEALEKKLKALKFTNEEARQAAFLRRFSTVNIVADVLRLYRARVSCGITGQEVYEYVKEMHEVPIDLFRSFMKYQPTVKGEDLLAQGYSGKELGGENGTA